AKPVHRQVTRYNPPGTPGAQECLTACVVEFDLCDGDCRDLYAECAAQALERATPEHDAAHGAWVLHEADCAEQHASDPACDDPDQRIEPQFESYLGQWEERLICVPDCGCGSRYDVCYQACGGTIAVADECVANCGGAETGTGTETETELVLDRGKLAVAGTPLLEGATVWIDGEEVGPVPWIGTLDEGYHRVEICSDEVESSPQLALVRPGEQTALEVDLSPRPAFDDEIIDPDDPPRDKPEGEAFTALKVKPMLGIPGAATSWIGGDTEDRDRDVRDELYDGVARFGIGLEVTGRRSANIGGGVLVDAHFLGIAPHVIADLSPLLWIRIPVPHKGRDMVEFTIRLGAGLSGLSSPSASELGASLGAESSSKFWVGWNALVSGGVQVNASEHVGIFVDAGYQLHALYADAQSRALTPLNARLGLMTHDFALSVGPVFLF
ncbi:MAG: hypothetical protein QGH45_18595, partial [Myxococcota bacterium]|nr:hypothetical protein [Myxococcota bacterium]